MEEGNPKGSLWVTWNHDRCLSFTSLNRHWKCQGNTLTRFARNVSKTRDIYLKSANWPCLFIEFLLDTLLVTTAVHVNGDFSRNRGLCFKMPSYELISHKWASDPSHDSLHVDRVRFPVGTTPRENSKVQANTKICLQPFWVLSHCGLGHPNWYQSVQKGTSVYRPTKSYQPKGHWTLHFHIEILEDATFLRPNVDSKYHNSYREDAKSFRFRSPLMRRRR